MPEDRGIEELLHHAPGRRERIGVLVRAQARCATDGADRRATGAIAPFALVRTHIAYARQPRNRRFVYPATSWGSHEDIDMGILRRIANLSERKGPAPRPKCLHGDITVGNNPALHAVYQNMDAEQRHLATTCLGAAEAAAAEMETPQARAVVKRDIELKTGGVMNLESAWEGGLIKQRYETALAAAVRIAEEACPTPRAPFRKVPLDFVELQIREQLDARMTAMEFGKRPMPWRLTEAERRESDASLDARMQELDEETPSLACFALREQGKEAEERNDLRQAYIAYRAAHTSGGCKSLQEETFQDAKRVLAQWIASNPAPSKEERSKAMAEARLLGDEYRRKDEAGELLSEDDLERAWDV